MMINRLKSGVTAEAKIIRRSKLRNNRVKERIITSKYVFDRRTLNKAYQRERRLSRAWGGFSHPEAKSRRNRRKRYIMR